MTLTPFADDGTSVTFGRLTVENRTDCVTLYGSLDVTRDQLGLARARALLAILTGALQRLEGEGELPAILLDAAEPKVAANPFE